MNDTTPRRGTPRTEESGTSGVLIDSLAESLTPVRPMRMVEGAAMLVLAAVATVLGVSLISGLWNGGLTGAASPFFYIVNGLLLVLGLASASTALRLAFPRVGNRHDGPLWAMAMVAILPLVAILTLAVGDGGISVVVQFPYGLGCAAAAIAASTISAAALFAFLKRGAPVSLPAAGLHLGVAAGALGSVAYGLSCPLDGFGHLAIYHVAPVMVTGLLGRLAVPRLLRW
ncbi:hypothetical protein HME9302_01981 [Alteripontixanthobacter maritimus]|uniref:Uncharacterized protein n=1 Tax=Alteripontixanthobacter maritimus TaxID=2161824 RepID=A0A369QB40_9SPHN|nr:DUF1109 domain-containing protein [Alteripontixanthobacter maritimus]RDC60765.1 hypothetical protein HME9302_01981 [Alteripontixanthobacter maritimus]